jgi:hypothetical protein
MPRKRGHDDGKEAGRNGAKTDEAAAGSPRRRPQAQSPKAKQRTSELAKKTPYGSERDRRRTG